MSTLQEDLMHLKTQITLLRNMQEREKYLHSQYDELRQQQARNQSEILALQASINQNVTQLPLE